MCIRRRVHCIFTIEGNSMQGVVIDVIVHVVAVTVAFKTIPTCIFVCGVGPDKLCS